MANDLNFIIAGNRGGLLGEGQIGTQRGCHIVAVFTHIVTDVINTCVLEHGGFHHDALPCRDVHIEGQIDNAAIMIDRGENILQHSRIVPLHRCITDQTVGIQQLCRKAQIQILYRHILDRNLTVEHEILGANRFVQEVILKVIHNLPQCGFVSGHRAAKIIELLALVAAAILVALKRIIGQILAQQNDVAVIGMLPFGSHIGSVFDAAFPPGAVAGFLIPGCAVHTVTHNGGLFAVDIEAERQRRIHILRCLTVHEVMKSIGIHLLIQFRERIEGRFHIGIGGQKLPIPIEACKLPNIDRTGLVAAPRAFKAAAIGSRVHGRCDLLTANLDGRIFLPLAHIADEGIEQGDIPLLSRLILKDIGVRDKSLTVITVTVNRLTGAAFVGSLVVNITGEIKVYISDGGDPGSSILHGHGQHRTNIIHIVEIIVPSASCVAAEAVQEQANAKDQCQAGCNGRGPFGPPGNSRHLCCSYITNIFILCIPDGIE